jgi:hypothetical protein
MSDFITAVIASTLRYAEAHPDHVHEASEIFRPMTDETALCCRSVNS